MRSRLLHRSAAITVVDVRCDGGSPLPGPEEESPVDQIVLVRSGVFVCSVARHPVVADTTRALFFRRGETYRTSHPTGGGDRCTSISVGTETQEPLPSSAPTTPADDLAHRRLVSSLVRREMSPLEADEAVLDLTRRIVAHALHAPVETGHSRRRIVDDARALMAARFDQHLRLDAIARELHCSEFHLCRAFRRGTGETLGRYQSRLRIRASLERLSAGERDLTRLALDLGFYDHSHFCRVFRREVGLSPSSWRSSNIVQAPR
ncbi:MAG: helix-turn-helix transcriptional regulator [Candidatus Eisenbacteria bacterium]